jgi:hypothetical protein
MRQHIHISDIDGKPAACYDTGLEPRSFARTKMSQCLIEPGYIVDPDGTHKVWKATGVNEVDGFMRVWGIPFSGDRLDGLLNNVNAKGQTALQAAAFWIRAKLFLGDKRSALNPGAVFVSSQGSAFFGPENLSQRCILMEGSEIDPFNCPDLTGIDAAAFCAGAMLYKIFSKVNPYSNTKDIYQDMREGVFTPIHFVVPGLDKKLCDLIQAALMLPVEKKKIFISGTNILGGLLELLMNKEGEVASLASFIQPLSAEGSQQLAKEKNRFVGRQGIIVKSRRFYANNKITIIGVTVAVLFVLFVVASMTKSRNDRPTTAGMPSDTVIREYYEAFSSLNHTFMEECIMGGADKSDLNVALNLFAITRVRQAHEGYARPTLIPARVWKDLGGEFPSTDVFGVTDLTITHLGGEETENIIIYRTDYFLWAPTEQEPSVRSDELTLRRDRRKNWRIAEINRTLKSGF